MQSVSAKTTFVPNTTIFRYIFSLHHIESYWLTYMVTNVKTLRGVRRRRLLLVSLMFVVLFAFMSVFVLAMDATDVVHVSSEAELVNAVNNASKPTIIILDNDITLLDNPLVISDEKDITLMSEGNWKFFKLIGANDIPDQPTVSVGSGGGVLRLKGITITHIEGVSGTGVRVNFDGTLIMLGGVISDNIASYVDGGGVSNSGTFQMLGGTISNNRAQNGGGVYNNGNFGLLGGKISNNQVSGGGGGVSNSGIFQMFGGTISNNYASTWNVGGGGVSNDGNFSMSGGKITCNTAGYEGRHYHSGVPSGYHYIGRGGGVYIRC